MRTASALKAAGATDTGRHREVNEDRFHVDAERGIFLVVDGVGGQAAGGKAADTAVAILRARLERETGPVDERIREAISAANNEIHRLASMRAEWAGMACVLTAAVLHHDTLVVGHVGDTRLYTIHDGRITKVTRDHSPVGEREDAGELSELEAMRNPRRNEVYRDVGSEPHAPRDSDFIDVVEVPFEADAALLLCTDGLTDLVHSSAIHALAVEHAGRPDDVVHALVAAANDAGGKDNVTVVYVEGETFAPEKTQPLPGRFATDAPAPRAVRRMPTLAGVAVVLAPAVVAMAAFMRMDVAWPAIEPSALFARTVAPESVVVQPSDSIMAALEQATPGTDVMVEPGEYRERIRLKDGVRLVSREPRAATIRLPSDASERDAAVVADGVSGAELTGFRIIGDAATPLGIGLFIHNASVRIVDIEIAGAAQLAIDIAGLSDGTIAGNDIHDNPGSALRVSPGATPRVTHNSFMRNGTAAAAALSLLVETGARPYFSRNVFHGIAPAAFATLSAAARAEVTRDNWFIEPTAVHDVVPRPGRKR